MSDYLNRYAVLNVINDAIANNALSYESCVNEIMEFIAKIPTADVAPVRHGRWIIDREFGNDVMSNEQMVICSVCGKGIFWGKQPYCPNCGAKMDGGENNIN